MRVLLVCSGGFTTSILVENMRRVMDEKEDYVEARPVSDVKDLIDKFDVVLLGPQVRFKLKEVRQLAEAHGKKAGLLDPRFLSTLDGKGVFELAKKIMEEVV